MQTPKSRTRLAASLLIALAALTWEPAAVQTRVGPRAGVNFATVTGDQVDDDAAEFRTGLLAGGFIVAPVADIVALHVGAQYTQKGFQAELLNTTRHPQDRLLRDPRAPGGRHAGWIVGRLPHLRGPHVRI